MVHKVIKSLILGILFILIGVSIKTYLKKMKAKIPTQETKKYIRSVEVRKLRAINHDIKVIGYGNIQPKYSLSLVSELSGKVKVNKHFLDGNTIEKGRILFHIDDQEYIIAENTEKASLEESRASLSLVKQEYKNAKEELSVNRRKLEIAKKEFIRYKALLQKKSVSISEFDKAEANYQQSLISFTQSKHRLNIIPSRILQAKARVAKSKSLFEKAKLDVKRTKIYSPFRARVITKHVHNGEFVNRGKVLGEIYNISTMEVKIPLTIEELRWITPKYKFAFPKNINAPLYKDECEVQIELPQTNSQILWNGKLRRISSEVLSGTRTINAIVEIKIPEEVPSRKLIKNMFVKISFHGSTLRGAYKIPRHLISNENTINVCRQNTLLVKRIHILRSERNYVYVSGDFSESDMLITTSLESYIDGMKVAPKILSEGEHE